VELYRLYRPNTLDEVVGNDNVKNQLKGMLKKDFVHALLLTGPSGCGKTSLARILRNELKCHDSEFMEIDAVDASGVDSIRELRDGLQYPPMFGSVKVYLLDECHRMSTTAQDCLLKCLENAPSYAYFILATTEKNKLIPTLRNRCVALEVSLLDNDLIAKKILWPIARKAGLNVEKEVLLAIGGNSGGSPRKAISVLERIAALPKEQQLSEANKGNDDETPQDIRELCQTLLKGGSWGAVSKMVKNIKEEPEAVRRMILGYMSAVLLNGVNPRAHQIMLCFEKNYYDTGKAGMTISFYEAVGSSNE
jgi:DNA polymerase III gamma/tau subunit